jgi:hypothetical protein
VAGENPSLRRDRKSLLNYETRPLLSNACVEVEYKKAPDLAAPSALCGPDQGQESQARGEEPSPAIRLSLQGSKSFTSVEASRHRDNDFLGERNTDLRSRSAKSRGNCGRVRCQAQDRMYREFQWAFHLEAGAPVRQVEDCAIDRRAAALKSDARCLESAAAAARLALLLRFIHCPPPCVCAIGHAWQGRRGGGVFGNIIHLPRAPSPNFRRAIGSPPTSIRRMFMILPNTRLATSPIL